MMQSLYIKITDLSDALKISRASIQKTCSEIQYLGIKNSKAPEDLIKVAKNYANKSLAKHKIIANTILLKYCGDFIYKCRFSYQFYPYINVLTISTNNKEMIDGMLVKGFSFYDENRFDASKFDKSTYITSELEVDVYRTLAWTNYNANMYHAIISNLKSGSIKAPSYDKIEEYYTKYMDFMISNKVDKIELLSDFQSENFKFIVNDIEANSYTNTQTIAVYYNDIEDLNAILSYSNWVLDPDKTKAYKGNYIKFEDMLELVLYEKELRDHEGRKTMSVTFQVTDACNLCCTYCYQKNKGTRRMDLDTAKKFIDFLLSRTKENSPYVNPIDRPFIVMEFVGGDGLMEIELVDNILTYFVEQVALLNHPYINKWGAYISSNGVLYRSPKVQEVIDKWSNIVSIAITVDGNKKLHDMCRVFPDGSGSYDLAMDALMSELHKGKGPSSKITLSPDNLKYFGDSIIDFINHGLIHIWFNGIYEHTWTTEEGSFLYKELKRIIDWIFDNNLQDVIDLQPLSEDSYVPMEETDIRNYCGGDGNMLAADPDGEFYNCTRYMGSSLAGEQEPLVIGHVDRGIGVTDKDISNINKMQCVDRRSQSTDECFYCPIARGCGWCSAYNYQRFGTVDKRTTTTCNLHKAEALAAAYYWNKIYRYKEMSKRFTITYDFEFVSDLIDLDEYNKLLELSKMEAI